VDCSWAFPHSARFSLRSHYSDPHCQKLFWVVPSRHGKCMTGNQTWRPCWRCVRQESLSKGGPAVSGPSGGGMIGRYGTMVPPKISQSSLVLASFRSRAHDYPGKSALAFLRLGCNSQPIPDLWGNMLADGPRLHPMLVDSAFPGPYHPLDHRGRSGICWVMELRDLFDPTCRHTGSM